MGDFTLPLGMGLAMAPVQRLDAKYATLGDSDGSGFPSMLLAAGAVLLVYFLVRG